jgi:hypothetical protein
MISYAIYQLTYDICYQTAQAKLNKADEYLKDKKKKEDFIEKIKNYSRNQLEIIFKTIIGYKNNVDYFNSSNNEGADHTINLDKYTTEDLIKQIQNFKENYQPMTFHKKYQNHYLYLKFQKKKNHLHQ